MGGSCSAAAAQRPEGQEDRTKIRALIYEAVYHPDPLLGVAEHRGDVQQQRGAQATAEDMDHDRLHVWGLRTTGARCGLMLCCGMVICVCLGGIISIRGITWSKAHPGVEVVRRPPKLWRLHAVLEASTCSCECLLGRPSASRAQVCVARPLDKAPWQIWLSVRWRRACPSTLYTESLLESRPVEWVAAGDSWH